MPVQHDVRKIGKLWVGAVCVGAGVRAITLSLKRKTEAMEAMRKELLPLKDDVAAGNGETVLEKVFGQIEEYFTAGRRTFDLPLDLSSGTEFQQAVWRACQSIPFGETRPYAWIAEKMGRPNAMRAVGGALGANPVPILTPCHRVLRSDGSIGGFSCGVAIKNLLLAHEHQVCQPH